MDTRNLKRLSKFMEYVLGRHPDEFGLLPDDRGYVKINALLQAIGEETQWRWLRPSHLRELMFASKHPAIEVDEKRIRARKRHFDPHPRIDAVPPKLLYTGVRKRAHAVVLQNGIRPLGGRDRVILLAREEMAERIARRLDPQAVILTVNVAQAQDREVRFKLFGDLLWLAGEIPTGCFFGPPLALDKHTPEKPSAPPPPAAPATPGSFSLPPMKSHDTRPKDKRWQRDRKNARRQKERGWK